MTAQISENLIYEDKEYSMCTEPLNQYFKLGGAEPKFESNCTALWRGYVGHWEIIDNRLYLIQLNGTLDDGTDVSLATIFPDYPERVFAHWYCDTLRLPEGKMLNYEHMGYASTYERDIMIKIEKGVVVEVNIKHNGESDNPDAPEGYGVGAFTTFSKKKKDDNK